MRTAVRIVGPARAIVAAWLVAAACAVALAQPAPGSDGADLAAVRVLRVGPAEETLDVWLGERRILSELGLGRPSHYVVVPAGRHELAVASPAGDAPGTVPPAALGSVDLAPGGYATVIVPASADGGGASEPASAAVPPFVVDDPLRELPPAGSAGLRLVHAAGGRPALTLAVRDADAPAGSAPPGLVDPPDVTLYAGRAAPMVGSDYTTIGAGSYRLWFVEQRGGLVLSDPVELQMRPGALYTVFVTGSRSGEAEARVVVSVDATTVASTQSDGSGAASLRLLHASPDAPLVDLLVDGRLTLRNVEARTPTAYAAVSPGWHLVEVFPHRLPGPIRLTGDGGGTRPADTDDAETDDASSAASDSDEAAAPDVSPEPPRLEPVTVYVDVSALEYTTLVLTGRFDPPPEGSTPGALSVAVDPTDAIVVVQGPGGGVASSPGPKLLDDLAPGTYRIEVRKEGYLTARYEVDVRSEGTAVVSVTLQRAPAVGEAASEDAASDDAAGEAETTEDEAPAFLQDSSEQVGRRPLELQVYASAIPTAGPGSARVRFVHVAPSVPPLEIVATRGEGGDEEGDSTDETLRVERLAYPNASPYLSVPAESQTLTFRVSGSQNRIRRVDGLDFRPGVSYTLYLVERASRLEFTVVPVVDAITPQRAPDGGSSR